jgi:hypothetical protein
LPAPSLAALFASAQAGDRAYLFVVGVPNLSGAVTASAEASIQMIRLSSVCPPTAVRAHIQEGYLLGEYPEMTGFDQKRNYAHYEIDFGRRLVAKFEFDPKAFWNNDDFPMVERSALYPNQTDPFYEVAETIKQSLCEEIIGRASWSFTFSKARGWGPHSICFSHGLTRCRLRPEP